MYVDKKYRDHDANDLLSYINRTERPIRDHSGQEMSSEDIQHFIDKSENYEYEESWIYGPKRGDEMSAEELSLAVRKTMREHLEDRQRASYCFAVHTDDETNHAHIAVAGAKDDLRTDPDDLDRMRELGASHTREQERDRERERKQERERDRDERRARKNARETERDRERDRDREQDRER